MNGRGEFKEEFLSPNQEYVAGSYLVDDGGATVRAQVRVGITSKQNAEKQYDDETIYWEMNTDKDIAKVIWLNEHIISVNDIMIDIHDKKTYYNWKHYIGKEK
ncbi:hypothetical protein GC105_11635 [Alkalibaculum sp. M08DMB]|uniref:Uncharacterized protein n=1 Tax=Alkalibaculum sporogenes TaxID=2655001 RepID=A0A6A7KAY2_9FIRM|nr:hypothetical protein [Alkalibaculum sporogenes]